ncbi:hypothetical protein C9374_006754 [Naegleria lovaniensis]|uniref:Signal sequence receptor subunit gamma n=1 Tax=Naegleria lovaniensis TaxID=51637 RepID=A0AA88GLJ6_NAELO|nr:uncharacterized protein C9374_006754 [Naegleria lovaniensis]KAG2379637.1 hypothetical protein C9374_006754 [Naegleria lovaniensis]
MATKQARKDDDKILNQFVKEAKRERTIDTSKNFFFYFVALLTTFLPSYLFQGVLNLEFSGATIVLYLAVSSASAYFLSKAYVFYYLRKKPVLSDSYEKVLSSAKGAIKKGMGEKEKLADLGATGHALFISNVIFFAITLFLSFYSLKRLDVRINYIASLTLASLATNYISKPRNK